MIEVVGHATMVGRAPRCVAAVYIGWAEHTWAGARSSVGLDITGSWGSAALFFLYETGKIAGLIALIVFGVGDLGTYLTPLKVQAFPARQPRAIGHALARWWVALAYLGFGLATASSASQ